MYVTVHLTKTESTEQNGPNNTYLSLHCQETAFYFVENTDTQLAFPLQENFYRRGGMYLHQSRQQ